MVALPSEATDESGTAATDVIRGDDPKLEAGPLGSK
jgi:hypothetical protein